MLHPNRDYFMGVLGAMESTEVEVTAVPYSEKQGHRFARREGLDGRQALDFAEQTLEEWKIPNLTSPVLNNPFRAYHLQKAGLDRVTLLLGTLPNPDTRFDLCVEIKQSV